MEEGETLIYRPLLRSGEKRKGAVTFVLVPADPAKAGEKLRVLDPKDAEEQRTWEVPWRSSVIVFVYGPGGLNTRNVKHYLERDEDLVSQLADYAEKTAQTEALIATLASPTSSAASVQSALKGFSSVYGLNVQIDRAAPSEQQAMTLLRTLNPAIAAYDPISPQGTGQFGQTAGLATSVATLFFGSPVGLAAGGTAMLLELRSLAFPKTEFRSSLSQGMPNEALGLCGRRDPVPAHTKVAYLWATRIPNIGPPQLSIEKANSLPAAVKSPLPLLAGDPDWKFLERARNWVLYPDKGKPIPIKAQKLGDTKTIELDLTSKVPAGKYKLGADWDWDHFQVKGQIEVKPLGDFTKARLMAPSQDLLVAKTGKVPVALEGEDYEFVTKVEIEKLDDKFAAPAAIPFRLARGLRQGQQERMDIQVNTIDLDPGQYKLLLTQVDGKPHAVNIKILPAPPKIANLPVVLNQGTSAIEFVLRGERLDLLKRVEVPRGTAELSPCKDPNERKLTLHLAKDIAAGTSLAVKAYVQDRAEPLTFADAVRIAGPRPRIVEANLSQPPGQAVALNSGELPGGMYLSAILRVQHLQSNSIVKLSCEHQSEPMVELHLGDRSGPLSLQQLAPDQVFLSFDTSRWLNGCLVRASIANGEEGESDGFDLGRIVRVPKIEALETVGDEQTSVVGDNLETIAKAGWSADSGEPVTTLPLPDAADARKQILALHLPAPPDPQAPLYLWLRGEASPRVAHLR